MLKIIKGNFWRIKNLAKTTKRKQPELGENIGKSQLRKQKKSIFNKKESRFECCREVNKGKDK